MPNYKIGLYEKAMPSSIDWKEKLQSAKKAGYDYIEISIDETPEKLCRLDWSNQERFAFLKLMSDEQMYVRSMCLSGHRKYPLGASNVEVQKQSLDIMKKALEFANDLGIRMIQLAGYDVYYEASTEQTRRDFEKNLRIATELAAEFGIQMGFETMELPFMNTVNKAMKYVNMMDSPYLNVYPDLGNITNAVSETGISVVNDLKTGAGHLIAMHLKETKPNVFREVPYGTGHVDFMTGINTAYELGVRRFVTEFWHDGKDDWQEKLLEANCFIRQKFELLDKKINKQ